MSMMWIVIGLVLVLGFVLLTVYNRLIALRQARRNAFADIDVQLKMRDDLIPNLVQTVKGYAAHESGVLEQVTASRAQAMGASSLNDKVAAENQLRGSLMNLMAVAENYPQLKADANFRALQDQLSDIEAKIAAARRFFNNATGEYNTYGQQFPASLFAGMVGFHEEPFFELDAGERAATKSAPKVDFSATAP